MKLFSLLGFLLALNFQAQAQTRPEWELRLDSQVRYQSFQESYGEDTNQSLFLLDIAPYFDWQYQDRWKFFLKPAISASPENRSTDEQFFFDLSEAYIRYRAENFTFQVGNMLHSWGVTDGYNPLDVLNSKQFYDPLHSKKLGSSSLVFSQNFERWNYDLVFIPQARGSILPGEKSRWLPREVFVPQTPENDLILLLPEDLRYHYGAQDSLNDALNFNYAFRLQRQGDLLDLSLYYFEGLAAFPLVKPFVTGTVVEISPKVVLQVDPDVTLNLQDYRQRLVGTSLVLNATTFLLKYAGTYVQSLGDDPYLPGWTQENILALEKTFNVGSRGFLVAVLQHSFMNSEKQNDSNISFSEVFRSAWMLGGKLSWDEVWALSLTSLYDTRHQSHLEELSLGRRLRDLWLLEIAAQRIDGPSESALGLYNKNNNFSLTVSRSF